MTNSITDGIQEFVHFIRYNFYRPQTKLLKGYVFIPVCHSVQRRLGGVQVQAQGGVSQHALRQTIPSRQLLLRTVRILLECILVANYFSPSITNNLFS